MSTPIRLAACVALFALGGCSPEDPAPGFLTWEPGEGGTPAPETFTWGRGSVELVPPPTGWKRQRLQTSLEGVSFRQGRTPPGKIDVGIYRSLHRTHTVRPVSGAERRFDPPPAGFTVYDVADRVRFDPDSLPPSSGLVVGPEVDRTVDGWPALAVDYTWRDRGHELRCREVYVVADECLYVASASGVASDLELFEQVLASIRFLAPEQ